MWLCVCVCAIIKVACAAYARIMLIAQSAHLFRSRGSIKKKNIWNHAHKIFIWYTIFIALKKKYFLQSLFDCNRWEKVFDDPENKTRLRINWTFYYELNISKVNGLMWSSSSSITALTETWRQQLQRYKACTFCFFFICRWCEEM